MREIDLDITLQQAIAAHRQGKMKDAEHFYRVILASYPKHPHANHNLGLISVSENKLYNALTLFKDALESAPKEEQFWLSYVDILIRLKRYDSVEKVIQQGKTHGLNSDRIRGFEELLTRSRGERNGIVQDHLAARSNDLLVQYESGKLIKTEELAILFIKEFPKHQLGWKVLGSVVRQLGRKSQAVVFNQKAVELFPEDPEAHCLLGVAQAELGAFEEAIASYNKAIKLSPGYSEAHNNLGNSLHALGRTNEAETCYLQALSLNPKYTEAHTNLGVTLQSLGRIEEAQACYTQAIELDPDFIQARENRWRLLFDKGEFESALLDADACIGKVSNERDLRTLYALGKIDEIYKRIEVQSKTNGENISIAAFAAFIAEVTNKDTVYNFCPSPMEFIKISNLLSHITDTPAFTKRLIDELIEVKAQWEPLGKTTVKGFQSYNGINLFDNPSKNINLLKSIILKELKAYREKYRNALCSYIQKWPNKSNLFGWYVLLKDQGHQTAHIHTGGWLSGVVYLKVVPPLEKNEGAIEFSLSGLDYAHDESTKLTYQPKSGDILFFPSSLHHRTIPFTTKTDRITISFDLMPT